LWENEKRPVMDENLYYRKNGKKVYTTLSNGSHRIRSLMPHKLIDKLLKYT